MKMTNILLFVTAAVLVSPAVFAADADFADENAGNPSVAFSAVDSANAIGVGSTGPAKLSLTEDQLEKIHAIKNKCADSAGLKKVELQSTQRKLRDLITQPDVDRQQVLQLQSKINGLRSDIANLRLAARLDGFDVLTTEQKKTLHERALKRQMMGGKHKRHGGRRHPAGPGRATT